ncbi:hypothetical protein KFE98_11855 [bacterium SCSIO 12741]|nr:hypothetical protein KFE98_11855 [bacterium SCSIO 12741]
MASEQEHLEALHDIREMMEKSTKFISLHGLSGVFIGILALVGAGVAYWFLLNDPSRDYFNSPYNVKGPLTYHTIGFILADAVVVLVGALLISFFYTARKAKKTGQSLFDKAALQVFYNMIIPLGTGGILCLILLFKGMIFMLAPLTLIFYGVALVGASSHTVKEIRFLGICEIIMGLLAIIIAGEGLLFWALGFGVLHIIYGIVMHRKYDRQ